MDSTVKFYRFSLILNIGFIILFLGVSVYFVSIRYPEWIYDLFVWSFYAPFIIYLIYSLFILYFIRSKYPHSNISNKNEGFVYLFAFIVFFVSIISLSFAYFLMGYFSEYKQKGNSVAPAFLIASISCVISSILSIMIGIFSFKFLKIVRKNLLTLAQQIKSLGTKPENDIN